MALILVAVWALRHAVGSTTLLVIAVVVPSIILHEVSHGVVALACGDDTAKRAGRLTLNPIRHIDPVGTVILPVLLALGGLGAFGYAKPVPVVPARMRHPRNDAVLVSLVGPATNLVLALLSVLLLRYARPAGTAQSVSAVVNVLGIGSVDALDRFLYLLGFVNVTLAVFNVLPIPPLDGSVLVERLLPQRALPTWWKVRRYSMVALLLLVLLDPNLLSRVFLPAERWWAELLAA